MLLTVHNHLPYPEAAQRRRAFDTENAALVATAASVALVAIGDSLVENWDLAAALPSSAGRLVNRGIGGDTAAGVAGRFAADALQLRPSRILALAGINDTWALDDHAALGDALAAQILNGLERMAQAAAHADQRLMLCALLPVHIPAGCPGSATNAPRNQLIIAVNRQIGALARRYQHQFLDLHTLLVADDGCTLRPELSRDGVHLNAQGYGLLNAALRAHLSGQLD